MKSITFGRMRIYIAGAHGSGKTTLARYTAKKYKLPLINEVARTVLAEKEIKLEQLRVDIDLVDDYQEEVFRRQIEEEKKYKDFVSDRTLDNLAYCAMHSRVLSKLINKPEFKNYVESVKEKDSIIFFVRPCKETLKNDGVRETVCWDGAIAIDAMIKLLFELYSIPYIPINSSSMQERIRLIDNIVSKILNNDKN